MHRLVLYIFISNLVYPWPLMFIDDKNEQINKGPYHVNIFENQKGIWMKKLFYLLDLLNTEW